MNVLPVAPDPVQRSAPRPALLAALLAATTVALLTWPWILSGWDFFTQKSFDHDRFHLPLVRHFAAQWPAVDLSDYPSATGPGMHLALATLAQIFGTGESMLQWLGSFFGIGLAATVAWRLAAWRGHAFHGFLLALPLCLNPYFLGNSIWVMTDNASLWMLAIVLLGTTFVAATPARLGRWGVAAAAACLVRQINLWVLPALVLGAWRSWRAGGFSRGPLAVAAVAATLPAIGLVAFFAWLWGGLTPPQFHEYHEVKIQTSALPYGMAVFGTYGAPLWLAVGFGGVAFLRKPVTIVALVAWIAMTGVARDSFVSLDEGRFGGWVWRLVDATPVPGGWSIALTVLSLGGTLLIARLVDVAAERGWGANARLAVVLFGGFLLAHAVNRVVAQRYFDPTTLLFLAMLAALAWPRGEDHANPRERNRWIVAVATVAAMQAGFVGVTLFRPLVKNGPTPENRVIEGVGETPWEESVRPRGEGP
jgi:hypothetical protein